MQSGFLSLKCISIHLPVYCRCAHGKEISAEKCIRSIVGIYNSKKWFVATTVNGCWPLVNENPCIPIITVNDGSLVLKNLSGNQRQKAKGWSSATPVEKVNGNFFCCFWRVFGTSYP